MVFTVVSLDIVGNVHTVIFLLTLVMSTVDLDNIFLTSANVANLAGRGGNIPRLIPIGLIIQCVMCSLSNQCSPWWVKRTKYGLRCLSCNTLQDISPENLVFSLLKYIGFACLISVIDSVILFLLRTTPVPVVLE